MNEYNINKPKLIKKKKVFVEIVENMDTYILNVENQLLVWALLILKLTIKISNI